MKKIIKFGICTMFIFLCIPSTICAALVNKHEQFAVAEIPGSDCGDVDLNGIGNSFIIPSLGNATSYYSTNHLISCVCGLKYLENHTGEDCCENPGGGGFDPIIPPSIKPGVM